MSKIIGIDLGTTNSCVAVEMQRKIAASMDCVLDGREIGSFVLPNAEYKFFVTAKPEVRAERTPGIITR